VFTLAPQAVRSADGTDATGFGLGCGSTFGTKGSVLLTALIIAGCVGDADIPKSAARTAASVQEEKSQGNGQLRIAAASDLKFALDDIVAAFNREHANAHVTVTTGSSGNFFAQLSNKAPFDLFLSADIEYARRLVDEGHGAPGSAFPYARGHIVLWTLKDSPRDIEHEGFALLNKANVKSIAVANPKTAPYGRAAVESLRKLGVYEAVEAKLVQGDSVSHAAQMVESGAADVGIIAMSLAVSPALREKGKYWQIPADAYQPILQGGAILSWAEDAALAGEFRDFLLSAQGASILKGFGFDTAGE
jgi:molybdate transport system substrate-binding protein